MKRRDEKSKIPEDTNGPHVDTVGPVRRIELQSTTRRNEGRRSGETVNYSV